MDDMITAPWRRFERNIPSGSHKRTLELGCLKLTAVVLHEYLFCSTTTVHNIQSMCSSIGIVAAGVYIIVGIYTYVVCVSQTAPCYCLGWHVPPQRAHTRPKLNDIIGIRYRPRPNRPNRRSMNAMTITIVIIHRTLIVLGTY